MKSGVSPATLITVSLITAVATLLAAALAALITSSVAKRNLKHAAEEAEKDRHAKAKLDVRKTRREAYASFLTACLKALNRIVTDPEDDSQWGVDGDPWNRYRSETRSSLYEVLYSQSLVAVEGPREVIKASEEARRAVQDFRNARQDYLKPGLEDKAKEEALVQAKDARSVATRAVNNFAKVARELLGS
ncbi:hypothetical protein [Streptomyces olivochromogenes]|uniref:hypothetical protein n=1 Tax=Streptomyces olivochromogenes TaxID=1963 RepID=UPI001F357643|nr:hypothetical protein [Streptomyces olivochromogenes]MCF3129837.1 hypothetical protein [Streptomyces olivochromogenes]